MILLRLISWPYFRKHVLRTLLTTAGIVLGVAVFVGMHTANQSVFFAFSQTVDRIAGKTELQVMPFPPRQTANGRSRLSPHWLSLVTSRPRCSGPSQRRQTSRLEWVKAKAVQQPARSAT